MTEPKTGRNQASVQAFLDSVENEKRRNDARVVLQLMREITGETPVMWGPSIVGFGSYHYRYESGREGDWMLTGFSPRRQALTLYIMGGFRRHEDLLSKLGKYKTGKACLYVNKLEDIDIDVMRQLVAESVAYMRQTYG